MLCVVLSLASITFVQHPLVLLSTSEQASFVIETNLTVNEKRKANLVNRSCYRSINSVNLPERYCFGFEHYHEQVECDGDARPNDIAIKVRC